MAWNPGTLYCTMHAAEVKTCIVAMGSRLNVDWLKKTRVVVFGQYSIPTKFPSHCVGSRGPPAAK